MKRTFLKYVLAVFSAVVLTACGGGGGDESARSVVLLFGDSLTENNGRFVTPNLHWTEKLKAERPNSTFIVSGVGGETTVGALKRLPGLLAAHRPTHIVISHGSNDYWRGCPGCYAKTEQNLQDLANMAANNGVIVILGDMTWKRGGPAEANAYSAMYRSAANKTGSRYVHMTANVPYDRVHYHADMIHFNNNAQEALKNSVVNNF